jgi:hypothetical protein
MSYESRQRAATSDSSSGYPMSITLAGCGGCRCIGTGRVKVMHDEDGEMAAFRHALSDAAENQCRECALPAATDYDRVGSDVAGGAQKLLDNFDVQRTPYVLAAFSSAAREITSASRRLLASSSGSHVAACSASST